MRTREAPASPAPGLAGPVVDAVWRLGSEAEARGEPLAAFVYDLGALRDRVAGVVAALPPGCRLFYAVKANPERPVLETLAGVVDGFEVASLGEIRKVRAVAPQAPVVFGGPGKTDAELAGALRHGVELVHVESVHEIRRLQEVAARCRRTASVLLRVNLRGPLPAATLAMAGVPTQFGIDETGVPAAMEAVLACPDLRFRGFHFHSVSNHLDAGAHARLVGLYLDRSARWAAAAGVPLGTVNAGGGFGVDYAAPQRSFDVDLFARDLGRELSVRRSVPLVFEPGRFLVAGCGVYATEVLDVKSTHGRHFVIVRGGTHHLRLPASWGHNQPFEVLPVERWPHPFPRPEVVGGPVTVCGQLCSPKDVLARDATVTRVRAGDLLVFQLAGAYGWTISHYGFLSHPPPVHHFVADRKGAGDA